jgi:hypothetical protein
VVRVVTVAIAAAVGVIVIVARGVTVATVIADRGAIADLAPSAPKVAARDRLPSSLRRS